MLYQLPSGRVIEISTEQYFDMTDEDIEYMIAYNIGDNIENPFFGSSMQNQDSKDIVIPDDIELDLVTKTSEQKLSDLDLDKTVLEE
jgi:hypothetical protein